MSTMAKNVIVAGFENRHPMLQRSEYDSWQSRMLLYIQGKEHGKQLLELVEKGPFQFGTIVVPGTTTLLATKRERTLDDLTPEEKTRQACDIKATNIVLQVIMENLVKISQNTYFGASTKSSRKSTDLTANTPYYSRPIRLEINALALSDRHPTYHGTPSDWVKMDDPNITMEEYIRLEEEKAQKRVSFDDSDDEDYTVIFDKNSFSYKIISINDLKTDLKNDNDKVNMPSFPSPEPTVSYFDDLDYFKDFEKEFPAIVYNDALTSKLDFLTEPTVSIRRILGYGYGLSTSCTVLGPTFAEFSQTLMVGPVAFGGSRVYDHGKGGLTCLIAKATTDESNKWHRRWIENQLNQKVKTIRCDNGTEFKNRDVIEFCGSKGIKREYSNARTPQQNGVAERKNRTLIEAARTMLADSFLPNTFWAEAVSTACYVLNRVLVTKPHNKTPYELLTGDSEIKKMNLLRLLCMPIWPSYSSKSTSALNQMIRKKSPRGGDPTSAVQTRSKLHKSSRAHAFVSYVQKQRRNNHKDFQHCLFACFLSQHEPKKISEALEDESWVDAMQEELLQFEIQKVWVLVDLPYGKKAIGTKWVYRNKKDERGVVVRNKASAFLYGKIDEEVYVSQPPGFIDPKMDTEEEPIDKTLFLKKDKHDIILVQVYVDDIIFGSTKKSWCDEFEALMKSRFQMSSMGELTFFLGLQTASTPIETQKPLVKDEEASDVDVHLYRSMIGSLMYLTASRPDIMFAVCACSRFQVTPKSSHLSAVKRIFRYLKGKPKLGLWYPRVSSFDLESYSDSDYAGANLDRKSTTGGCQFLGRRLISWQCKKQTIVATSTTEAEYVAAASCCGQVLWIQNQMLDYGFNFMNTKIYIDNESTICIVKNPHNMVAYLEKSKGNAEFHEVIDFLKRSSIHHALIVLLVEFLEVLHPVINPFLGYEGDMISKVSMISVSLSKDSQEKASQRNIGCTKSLYPNKGGSLLKRMLMMKGGDSENDDEDKEIDENILCTEDVLSTDKEGVSTDMEKVSTDRQIVSTDGSKVGTDRQIEGTEVQNEGTQEKNEGTQEKNEGIQEKNEGTEEKNEVTEEHIEGTEEQVESTDGQRKGIEDHTEEESATQATQTPTSTIFGDDETIAKVLLNMSQAKAVSREKEKGVELKDIEETDRPRPTSTRSLLTLKPLPKD
ncbi:putative ribonuclease H-like domain-containing protein [Tanacetum coccineum]